MSNISVANIKSSLRMWRMAASTLAAVARRSIAMIDYEINSNKFAYTALQMQRIVELIGKLIS